MKKSAASFAMTSHRLFPVEHAQTEMKKTRETAQSSANSYFVSSDATYIEYGMTLMIKHML